MRLLETSEILNLVEYERVRETRRREIIELKKRRRVSVGRYLTFVFENRETVWFQVQEMVRAERIVDDAKIAEEVEVYNALLPVPGELAATMLMEITASAEIKPVLDKRSEERRVGKECRSRWSKDHGEKKNTRDETNVEQKEK